MIFYIERFSTWLFVLKMIWKSVKTAFMIRKIAISVNYPAIFRNSVAKFSRYSEVPESNQSLLVSRLVKDPFHSEDLSVVQVLCSKLNLKLTKSLEVTY